MESTVLTAHNREQFGTRAATALRLEGGLLATVVGAGKPTQVITLDQREFDAAIRKGFRVFELELAGDKQQVIIQEAQWDALGDHLNQVDFLRDPDGSIWAAREAAKEVVEED